MGEGPPLLLLNGIGGNIEMWGALAQRLPGRRLVMFDAPGTGGSPPLRRPVRMAGYVQLVTDLLDALGIDRADVLGYSWGGALAQELAFRAPRRVRRLVLCATVPGLGGQPPAPWVIGLMATPARYYSETYLRLVSPLVFGPRPGPDADTGHATARKERPPTMRGYSQQLYAISGWSSRRFLHRITAPVLVLAGDRDPPGPAAQRPDPRPRAARLPAARAARRPPVPARAPRRGQPAGRGVPRRPRPVAAVPRHARLVVCGAWHAPDRPAGP